MAAPDRRTSVQENFDRSHATHARSATLQRIWRDAYSDEYPAEASPNGFIPRSILRRLADELRVAPGETLVDLGCGHGGPGLWVAQQSGANLVGVDLSPVGVALARERAFVLGVDARTAFRVGDVCATGLPDGGFDAAMSLDVLTFVLRRATRRGWHSLTTSRGSTTSTGDIRRSTTCRRVPTKGDGQSKG